MTSSGDFAAADGLFDEIVALPDGDPRRASLTRQIVTVYQPMARRIARRFSGRGEDLDDLEQVAAVGLVKAADRFDPARGVPFLSFAIPTMMGELRRYFRDTAWAVRLPRRLSERYLALNEAIHDLSQRLGRAAKPTELAAHLSITVEEVYEGLEAGQSYRAESLDASPGDTDAQASADRFGAEDGGLGAAEDRAQLGPALAHLSQRERDIVAMRFFEGLTQTEIAERVGVSQMQVSRLLSRTLATLRAELSSDAGDAATEV